MRFRSLPLRGIKTGTAVQTVLDILKVADNIKGLITQSMSTWRTKLESNCEVLGEVSIKRGIFQGDSLSPLLFVMAIMPLTQVLRNSRPGYEFKNKLKINHLLHMDDLKLFTKTEDDVESLINTVRIVSDDIRMQFGLSKCPVIALKRGKTISSGNIRMPDGELFRSLGGSFKCLGILETDQIKQEEMKGEIEAEYFSRVRKVLKPKLKAGNTIKDINILKRTNFVSPYSYDFNKLHKPFDLNGP